MSSVLHDLTKVVVFIVGVFLLTVAVGISAWSRRQLSPGPRRLGWAVLALGLLYLLSFIFSRSAYLSLAGTSGYYSGGVICFLAFLVFCYAITVYGRDESSLHWFGLTFAGVVGLGALVSVFQIFGVHVFPWEITKDIHFNVFGASSRAQAVLVAIGVALTMGLVYRTDRRWRRVGYVLGACLGIVLLWAIGQTLVTYLFAGVVLAQLALLSIRSQGMPRWWVVLPTALVVMISGLTFVPVPQRFQDAQSSSLQLDTRTSAVVAWQSIGAAPLWGSGPQTFIVDFNAHRPVSFNQTPLWNLRFAKASNEWWGMAATAGLVVPLLMLALAVWATIRLVRALLSSRRPDQVWTMQLTVGSAWVLVLAASFVMSFGFTLSLAWWSLLGMVFAVTSFRDAQRVFAWPARSRQHRIVIAVSVLVMLAGSYLTYYYFRLWRADYHYARAQRNIAAQESFDLIERDLLRATSLNPHESSYYQNMAQGYVAQAQLAASDTSKSAETTTLVQKAVSALAQARAASPQDPATYEQEAALYDSLRTLVGNVDELSINAYSEAVARDPVNPLLRLNRGRARLLLAQRFLAGTPTDAQKTDAGTLISAAMTDFSVAAELKPDYLLPEFNLALAHVVKGERDQALAILQSLAQRYPDNPDILYTLGTWYQESEKSDQALELYARVLAIDSSYLAVHWQRALIYQQQGKKDEAIAELKSLETANPGNTAVQEKLQTLTGDGGTAGDDAAE